MTGTKSSLSEEKMGVGTSCTMPIQTQLNVDKNPFLVEYTHMLWENKFCMAQLSQA